MSARVVALIPRAELVVDRIHTVSGRYRPAIERAYRVSHPFPFSKAFERHGYWCIEVKAEPFWSLLFTRHPELTAQACEFAEDGYRAFVRTFVRRA